MEKILILQGLKLEELLKEIETIFEKKIQVALNAPKIENKEKLLTRKEVAEYFKISPVTLHNWSKSGAIPSYKIGSRVFYKAKEIERLVSKNERMSRLFK